MLAFTFVMIAAVLIFIVPIFEKMFKNLGGQLPPPTQFLVDASHNMCWLGPLLIVGDRRRHASGSSASCASNPAFRLVVDKLKLRLPVFGPLFRSSR